MCGTSPGEVVRWSGRGLSGTHESDTWPTFTGAVEVCEREGYGGGRVGVCGDVAAMCVGSVW